MNKRLLFGLTAILITVFVVLAGCSGAPAPGTLSVARVQKGDLEVKVSADGSYRDAQRGQPLFRYHHVHPALQRPDQGRIR